MQLTLFTDQENLEDCNKVKQVLQETKFNYIELPFEQLLNKDISKAPVLQIELETETVYSLGLEQITRWAYLYSRRRDAK